jgi:hypothetical protein
MARQRKVPETKENDVKTPCITVKKILSMTVIQLRAFIESQQNPELDNIMDIYNRELLQNKLIEKMGL